MCSEAVKSENTSVTKVTGAVEPSCRFCDAPLRHLLVDLGTSPLCESYVSADDYNQAEPFYPLRVHICDRCFLAQLEEFVPVSEIFSEYAYFSSYSDSWVEHARRYANQMARNLQLGTESLVVEIASNDGYLLQHFVKMGIPVLGIEPAANVAKAAVERRVPTLVRFFGRETADEMARGGQFADLLTANNVLAQVPDVRDFVAGIKTILTPRGVVTIEFPHLVRLMESNQFDTIYHEHYSYFSFYSAERILESAGLRVYRVDRLPTHGGSLRVYATLASDLRPVEACVDEMRRNEEAFGINRLDTYRRFAENVRETKRALLEFLIEAKRAGKRLCAYGAPGKGNTLLNYCGVRTDFLDFTVDRNPYKQGKFLPGTRIPIRCPEALRDARPDYVLILPWNLKDEIINQAGFIREWGGRFVVPIPAIKVYD